MVSFRLFFSPDSAERVPLDHKITKIFGSVSVCVFQKVAALIFESFDELSQNRRGKKILGPKSKKSLLYFCVLIKFRRLYESSSNLEEGVQLVCGAPAE